MGFDIFLHLLPTLACNTIAICHLCPSMTLSSFPHARHLYGEGKGADSFRRDQSLAPNEAFFQGTRECTGGSGTWHLLLGEFPSIRGGEQMHGKAKHKHKWKNKRSRETNSHLHRKVLRLIRASTTSVIPIRRGLVKGKGCVLSISLGLPRQRGRSAPSCGAPKGRIMTLGAEWGPLGSGLSLPHPAQGTLRSGAVSPCHTMN